MICWIKTKKLFEKQTTECCRNCSREVWKRIRERKENSKYWHDKFVNNLPTIGDWTIKRKKKRKYHTQ